MAPVQPNAAIADHASRLLTRQDDGSSGGGSSSCSGNYLSSGAIAGIVLGTIAGTLLVLWIIRSCFNPGAPPRVERDPMYHEPAMRTHHHSRRHSGHSGHSRRRSYSVDSSAPPPVVIREHSRRRSQQPTHVFVGGSGNVERGRTYV